MSDLSELRWKLLTYSGGRQAARAASATAGAAGTPAAPAAPAGSLRGRLSLEHGADASLGREVGHELRAR